MNIKAHFDHSYNLDLTAAHIGINKWNWSSTDIEDERTAMKIMAENRFDVLPIVNPDKTITKYYSTRKWNNYENLNLNKITESDKLYYKYTLPDLVKKFNQEDRHFYFLTNHKEIIGLISFIHLNSKSVYNYLFQVISDIEISVSEFLKSSLDQQEIISNFETLDNKHIQELLETFKKHIATGNDNSIFEYMYLQTLGITMNKMSSKLPHAQKKLNKYQAKFSPRGVYGELRNIVMHPVRPILNNKDTISKMDELFDDYAEIKHLLSL